MALETRLRQWSFGRQFQHLGLDPARGVSSSPADEGGQLTVMLVIASTATSQVVAPISA